MIKYTSGPEPEPSTDPEPLMEFACLGNSIKIYEDGTKVREWDPEAYGAHKCLPESIDLKITGHCEAGCYFCHESSTPKGEHADLKWVENLLARDGFWCGELAIGGGDPLSHPDLVKFLDWLRFMTVNNLTVNERNITRLGLTEACYRTGLIHALIKGGMINGVGLSLDSHRITSCDVTRSCFESLMSLPNAVVHVIAGIHEPIRVAGLGPHKLLILGYKDFGFGKRWTKITDRMIQRMRYFLPSLVDRLHGVHSDPGSPILTAFDNLALEQLGVRDMVEPETWNSRYMGVEGSHTMYLDAVRQEFAVSSTGPRHPCGELSLQEMFTIVRKEAGLTTNIEGWTLDHEQEITNVGNSAQDTGAATC